VTDSATAEHAADQSGRRALLGAGVIGAALAAALARPAAAASTPTSDADMTLTAFAIGLELAARDLYQAVIDGGATATAWDVFRNQHESYAQRLAGVTGQSANTRNDDVYQALAADFSGDKPANAAFRLENAAAATHAAVAGMLDDTAILEVVAAIGAMESRHAAYFAERSGRGDSTDALFRNDAEPITPEATS
jgi:hypothetical protein